MNLNILATIVEAGEQAEACGVSEIVNTATPHLRGIILLLLSLSFVYLLIVSAKARRKSFAANAQNLQNQEEILRLLRELVTIAKTHTLMKPTPEPAKPVQESDKETPQP